MLHFVIYSILTALSFLISGRRSFQRTKIIAGIMLIGFFCASRINPQLEFINPWQLLIATRTQYWLIALAIPLIIRPLTKVLTSINHGIVYTFGGLAALYFALPLIYPVLLAADYSRMNQVPNADGLIFQTTSYSCGAAAAAMSMFQLGITTSEGTIAKAAYTNPLTGTEAATLTKTLNELFANEGIHCDYLSIQSINEIKTPFLAVIKLQPLIDHFVLVEDIRSNYLIVADPLQGRVRLTLDEFSERWRGTGITCKKTVIDEQ